MAQHGDNDGREDTRTAMTGAASPRDRLRLVRAAPSADFLSQLIAEYQHLPPQRARRRAPVCEALAAYASGAHIAERRMPPGYRKTIVT